MKADPAFEPAFQSIMGLLTLLLPGYAREGRAYLTVAFGCTGGRHRSVTTAEAAGAVLAEAGWANAVLHRDRSRGPEQDAPAMEDAPATQDAKGGKKGL